jgi:hypothetical protein
LFSQPATITLLLFCSHITLVIDVLLRINCTHRFSFGFTEPKNILALSSHSFFFAQLPLLFFVPLLSRLWFFFVGPCLLMNKFSQSAMNGMSSNPMSLPVQSATPTLTLSGTTVSNISRPTSALHSPIHEGFGSMQQSFGPERYSRPEPAIRYALPFLKLR